MNEAFLEKVAEAVHDKCMEKVYHQLNDTGV